MSEASTFSARTQESSATRTGPLRVMVMLATVVMALSALQFALAGFGAFGRDYTPHIVIGWVIAGVSVLVLAAAFVARPGTGALVAAVVLAVFAAVLEPLLVDLTGRGGEFITYFSVDLGRSVSQWIGAMHAFVGLIIFGTAGRLMGAGRNGGGRPANNGAR